MYFFLAKYTISEKHRKGIPQGTSLSAVLANIYMIEFDEWVNNYLQQFNGFYRRYSDDFIVVIPNDGIDMDKIEKIKKDIITRSLNKLSLVIKKEKTSVYHFEKVKHQICRLNVNGQLVKSELNYLGFSFDGGVINLRPKTIYKFHYKGKRAINELAFNIYGYHQGEEGLWDDQKLSKGEQIVMDSVEKGFSIPRRRQFTKMYLVSRPITKQNLVSYASNAQRIFSENNGKYSVNILKQTLKQVGYLQRKFNKDKSKYGLNRK